MKKLILASNNLKKIKEIKEILNGLNLEVFSLNDMNIDIEVEEDGKTFEENAKKKAYEIYQFLLERGEKDFIVLSDDSGLEVECLNGKPGVYSARYAGEHGNDYNNNVKLLEDMNKTNDVDRVAKFVCVITVVFEDGIIETVRGEVMGYITEELKTEGGFGYDPIFYSKELNKTFGEATAKEKNDISHRGRALREIKKVLNR